MAPMMSALQAAATALWIVCSRYWKLKLAVSRAIWAWLAPTAHCPRADGGGLVNPLIGGNHYVAVVEGEEDSVVAIIAVAIGGEDSFDIAKEFFLDVLHSLVVGTAWDGGEGSEVASNIRWAMGMHHGGV